MLAIDSDAVDNPKMTHADYYCNLFDSLDEFGKSTQSQDLRHLQRFKDGFT